MAGGVATNISFIEQHLIGFTPEMLHRPIEKILEQYQQGNKELAKGQLTILREMGYQDPSILPALDVVTIYLDLLDSEESTKIRDHLVNFLSQASANRANLLLVDLCMAALLRLEARNAGIEKAKVLWENFNATGVHSKETYYALIASADELQEIIESRGALLTATELRGIVEGAIRLNQYELTNQSLKHLYALDTGPHTRFLRQIADAMLIQSQIDKQMFWSVTATIHDKLIQLADDVAEQLAIEPLVDSRLPLFAATLLIYIHGESDNLLDACWKRIELIDRVHTKCADFLRLQHGENALELAELGKKLQQADKDEVFRKQCLDELLCSPAVSSDNCAFLIRYASPDSLKKWLIDGGEISAEEGEFSRKLLRIYLQCCSIDIGKNRIRHRQEVLDVKMLCQTFLDSHKDELVSLNPEFVIDLAGRLLKLHLPEEALVFVRPILPTGDYWLSPLLRCYLDALNMAEKYATIKEVLREIPDRHWDRMVWQIKARLDFLAGEYEEARKSLEMGLARGANAQIVVGIIEILQKLSNGTEISKVLSEVSDDILTQGDAYSHRLIIEMFRNGYQKRAERILLDWFVADPEASAANVTDIFNALMTHHQPMHIANSPIDIAITGVEYRVGETTLTKLIVPPEKAKGQHLLSSISPLGKHLLEVDPKESFKEGIITYQLEERLPPIVAAYRISSYIRDNMNPGDDPFHIFKVPDNPEAFLTQLQDIMSADAEGRREILKQEILPIMFKGQMLGRTDPFVTALGLLSDSNASKNPLPKHDSEDSPSELLLDVYVVAYIAITGIAPGLIALDIPLCISLETETYIRKWLDERKRENGGMLTNLPDGRPLIFTVEDIRRRTEHIADQVLLLLEKAKVVQPQLIDLSPELTDLHDVLDPSVYSTLRLATTIDIPWLCIDLNMAQMVNSLNWPVVKNCLLLFTKASVLTPLSDRKFGLYRHAYEQLPFPLRFQDLLELSHEEEVNSTELLTKLLLQYPTAFQETEYAAQALTELLLPVLAVAFKQGKFRGLKTVDDYRFPSHVAKLANACFYVASRSGGKQKAEYKISVLLNTIIRRLVVKLGIYLSQSFVDIITALAEKFLFGHFMSVEAVNKSLDGLLEASVKDSESKSTDI